MQLHLYRDQYDNPKANAQANLNGRTFYVTTETLRFHKSRVVVAQAVCSGQLFCLVCYNAGDGYHWAIFNLLGHCVAGGADHATYETKNKAILALSTAITSLDAKAVNLEGITREIKRLKDLEASL